MAPFKVTGAYGSPEKNSLDLMLRYIESPHTDFYLCRISGDSFRVETSNSRAQRKNVESYTDKKNIVSRGVFSFQELQYNFIPFHFPDFQIADILSIDNKTHCRANPVKSFITGRSRIDVEKVEFFIKYHF